MSAIDKYQHKFIDFFDCPSDYDLVYGSSTKLIAIYQLLENIPDDEDDFDGVMKTHFFNRSYFGCAPQEPPTHALNTGNYLLYWTVSRFGPHDNSGIIEIFIPETDTLELTIEY